MPRGRWTNWAGNLECECEIATPASLDELQALVKRAAAAGGPIRSTGGHYSWSPLVPNEGTIVEMRRLDRLIDLDVREATAEVECGMTIGQLSGLAAKQGLTLVSPTLFPKPTVGGAIAAGCHGTDRRAGCFSDDVLELKIVTADGSLRTLSKGDADFPAAQVALGTLGIVYSAKIRLAPQFNVHTQTRWIPVEQVLAGFEDLQASTDHLELFWWPFQDSMWVMLMDRTASFPDPKTWWTRLHTAFTTWYETNVGGIALPFIARYLPALTPFVLKVSSRVADHEGVDVQTASDAFHFQKAYPKCWDLSYAFPAPQAARAWREGIDLVNQYSRVGRYPVNLLLHGRFTGGSAAWLAPDHARATGYIEVTTIEGTRHWQGFFGEMERRWFAIEGSRPHWCKLYGQWHEIAARYPKMNDFLDVRQRWDPERVFLNDFLEKQIFQLPERASARQEQQAARPDALAPPGA